ncbi:hypothetical protein Tco_0417592 [Tanacetum coccineum]
MPVFSDSTILHFESTSEHEASVASIAEADLRNSDPNDLVSKQQDKTKSASEGLENISPAQDDATKEIKLEDLTKLIPNMEVDFMDLDSPNDDAPIIVQDDDAKEVHAKKVHAEQHKETEDALASHPLSLKTIQIQELNKQVHLLQTLNSKLVKEKELAKTKVALLKEKPSFPNVEQLTEVLVTSLKPEFSKLSSSHDFSNSILTKLKELPSKFKDITREIRELNMPEDLDALRKYLLPKGPDALDMFTQAIESASHKAGN